MAVGFVSFFLLLTLLAGMILMAFRETRKVALALLGFCAIIFILGWYWHSPAYMHGSGQVSQIREIGNISQSFDYQGINTDSTQLLGADRLNWFKFGLIAVFGATVLGVLLMIIILLLSNHKFRPYGIAALAVAPVLIILIIMGLNFDRHLQPKYSDAILGLERPVTNIRQKIISVNPQQAIAQNKALESAFSQQMQTKSDFPLNGRMVRNILLPLPPALPEGASPEFLQKKIAALEKTIDDMSRMLVNIMTERAKDDITAKTESLAANSSASGLAAATKAQQRETAHVQPVSTNGSPAKTASADKAEQTAPAEREKTAAASSLRRPDWVGKPSRLLDDSYQMSVCTDPYTSRMECDAKIPDVLQGAVDQFVEAYHGRPAAGWVRLPPEKLKQLVVEEWEEPLQLSMGPMTRVHLLLNFDKKAKNLIDEALNYGQFTERAAAVGSGLIGVWMLLAVVWGYLKLDLASKGAYRKRLRAAAGFVILIILAMGYSVLRFFA